MTRGTKTQSSDTNSHVTETWTAPLERSNINVRRERDTWTVMLAPCQPGIGRKKMRDEHKYSQSHRKNHLYQSVSCQSESLSIWILFINIWGDWWWLKKWHPAETYYVRAALKSCVRFMSKRQLEVKILIQIEVTSNQTDLPFIKVFIQEFWPITVNALCPHHVSMLQHRWLRKLICLPLQWWIYLWLNVKHRCKM